ncbi:hypothetical protein KR026_007685 [Drosophila bipectinata]|nr:hypothetical protein KR026_007685 [Drosophila bipectinata]
MARCLFVFLLATLIVMESSAQYEDTTYPVGFADYEQREIPDFADEEQRMKRAAIASSASSEIASSPEEENAKAEETPIVESAIVSDSGEDFSPKAEKTPVFKSSSDSDSAEESPKSE